MNSKNLMMRTNSEPANLADQFRSFIIRHGNGKMAKRVLALRHCDNANDAADELRLIRLHEFGNRKPNQLFPSSLV